MRKIDSTLRPVAHERFGAASMLGTGSPLRASPGSGGKVVGGAG